MNLGTFLSSKSKTPKRNWKNYLFSGLMIFVTLGILCVLLYRQKDLLFSYDWNIRWQYIFFAWFVDGLLLFLGTFVFGGIVDILDKQLPFHKHFNLFCINMLTRRLPGSLWYVLYRNKAYKDNGYSPKTISLASGVELAVAIVSGLLISGVFSTSILQELKLNIWLLIIFFVIGFILLQPGLLGKLIKKLGSNPDRFGYAQLFKWIVSYLFLWVGGGLCFFFIINSIYPIELNQLTFVIGSWALVGTITQFTILLPSNFGITEISLSLLLSIIIPSSIAVIIVVALRITMIIFEILWTVISMVLSHNLDDRTSM